MLACAKSSISRSSSKLDKPITRAVEPSHRELRKGIVAPQCMEFDANNGKFKRELDNSDKIRLMQTRLLADRELPRCKKSKIIGSGSEQAELFRGDGLPG